MNIKICNVCNKEFPATLDFFHKTKGHKFGLDSRCKPCKNTKRRERYAKNKEKMREWRKLSYNKDTQKNYHLKQLYGITLDEYKKISDSQNGICKVCGGINENGQNLAVDHDHDTGKIRGLLCHKCNQGIGCLKDSPDLLKKAAKYLEDNK